jgi:hypothetical protein
MLFGHQHNDASTPAPEPTAAPAAPSLNPLAVDPSTGVSLPVPTEAESLTTPESTIVQPTADSTLTPGPATPPPPPPIPTSAPTVGNTAPEETPAAAEPTPGVTPTSTSEETPTPQPTPAEEPTMPFDDPQERAGGYKSDVIQTGIDENDPQAILADFISDDSNPSAPLPPLIPKDQLKQQDVSASSMPADLLNLKQEALAQLTPLVDKLDQTPEERFRTKMMMLQSTDNQELLKDAYQAAQQITDEKARAQALLDVINEINYFNSLSNNQQ